MARRTELRYADAFHAMKFIIERMPDYSVKQAKEISDQTESEIEAVAFGALWRAKEWMLKHGGSKGSDE